MLCPCTHSWALIVHKQARLAHQQEGGIDATGPLRRWKLYLTVVVVIVVAVLGSLTYYVISTPTINHLAKVDESLALKSIPFYYNSTYKFNSGSAGSAERLAALQISLDNRSGQGGASLYLFKIGEGNGKDLAIPGLDYQSNVTGGYFQVITWKVYFQSNMTVIGISYYLGEVATYNLDFGLQVQIYSSVLFLPVAQEKLRIPIHFVIHYG